MTRSLPLRRAVFLGLFGFAAAPAYAQNIRPLGDDLILNVPPGFEAFEQPGRIELEQTRALRTPLSIWISASEPVALHSRLIHGRYGDIRYTVEAQEMDGSGGDFYELRARRILPDGREVGLLAYRQSERRPDFSVALDVLASVQLRDPS
ncbi:Tsi3 family protein [Gymnodinialimonas hymeniacidonis]|uniref:Tsi3 family protein n=1 Tax=Gymnodinialimonas hymeniacidonis TaxID=3126508 RepID=UPI0034C63A7C